MPGYERFKDVLHGAPNGGSTFAENNQSLHAVSAGFKILSIAEKGMEGRNNDFPFAQLLPDIFTFRLAEVRKYDPTEDQTLSPVGILTRNAWTKKL